MALLKVSGVRKEYRQAGTYPTEALRGIQLRIEEGEFVAIMGPSGSGKTTLLNIVSGVDRADAGSVEIEGKEISKLSDQELAAFRRRRIGIVFQEFNLLDSLTAAENVMLPLVLDHCDPEVMETRAKEAMSLLGVEEIAEKYPYQISGGEQQRVAVCRAVINDPDIVLADEPTGNLDSRSSRSVMQCFEDLNRRGRTILMVTHDVTAASYCHKIVFIKDGRAQQEISRGSSRENFIAHILQSLEVGA